MKTAKEPSRRALASSTVPVAAALAACAVLLAAAPAQAVTYGLKSYAPTSGDSSAPTHLYTFFENGSGLTAIGAVRLGGADIDADGLAFTQQYGLLAFNLAGGGSTLISINPTTGVATTIGSLLSGRNIRGATFDGSGTMWALDSAADQLLTINPTSGAVLTQVGLTLGGSAFNLGTCTDIALRPDTGVFYLTNAATTYTLNAGTGALTAVYTDTGLGLAGAAFSLSAPADYLFTYEINGTDDIFRYDVDPSFSGQRFTPTSFRLSTPVAETWQPNPSPSRSPWPARGWAWAAWRHTCAGGGGRRRLRAAARGLAPRAAGQEGRAARCLCAERFCTWPRAAWAARGTCGARCAGTQENPPP